MMDRTKETAFLKLLLLHLGADETGLLTEPLNTAERNERCIRRALLLSTLLSLIALAGLCYSVVFLPDFFRNNAFQNWSEPAIKLFSVLALASFISSLAFGGGWLWYRRVLHRRHTQCRRFLTMLIESRSAAPRTNIVQAPLADFLSTAESSFAPAGGLVTCAT
jgi:hypothetical protein